MSLVSKPPAVVTLIWFSPPRAPPVESNRRVTTAFPFPSTLSDCQAMTKFPAPSIAMDG